MKHTFLTLGVLVVMSFGNLKAQENLRIKSFIGRKFETDFAGASNVEWTKGPSHYMAAFTYNNEIWLAFYNMHGESLASGRRLKDMWQLPLQFQLSIAEAKRKVEREFGTVSGSFAIELVRHADSTYNSPRQNNTPIMVCSDNSEVLTINGKVFHFEQPMTSNQLLARSN
ncbi:MAG: hypothetical protein WKF87_18835 [Chryseolinea sp.]